MGIRVTKWTSKLTTWLGSTPAIIVSWAIIVTWVPFAIAESFSSNIQIPINTITTIITFLMVFIIQASQNRDGRAIQTKLDAILRDVNEIDEDILIGIEDQPEKAIQAEQARIRERPVQDSNPTNPA